VRHPSPGSDRNGTRARQGRCSPGGPRNSEQGTHDHHHHNKADPRGRLSAIVAGFLYILVQFVYPHEEPANVATTGWAVTHILTLLMALLAIIGVSGMYLRQVKQTSL
jgi:hypothetical protein